MPFSTAATILHCRFWSKGPVTVSLAAHIARYLESVLSVRGNLKRVQPTQQVF
jgi:hypothetical protein